MLKPRIVVCLDVRDGRVVKGTRFRDLRDVGDPVELAGRYEEEGADEMVFLDIGATPDGRDTLLDTVRRTAEVLTIPLTVGGGVRSVEGMEALLRAGADKIGINSAAVADPELIGEGARRFGAQCIVASIDAARIGDRWIVHTHGGRTPTELDAIEWAVECETRGAGEILATSIDRDGARTGYDLDFLRALAARVTVPVIASGGAGTHEHLRAGLEEGGASAVLVAGILHDGITTVGEIKAALRERGLALR